MNHHEILVNVRSGDPVLVTECEEHGSACPLVWDNLAARYPYYDVACLLPYWNHVHGCETVLFSMGDKSQATTCVMNWAGEILSAHAYRDGRSISWYSES